MEVDNLGADMAIDEKQIGGDFYTILTNRNSGKIALLAQTIKVSELSQIIPKFGLRGFYVKSITRDLSPAYDWFSRQFFCNALHTADKFHIIRHLLDFFKIYGFVTNRNCLPINAYSMRLSSTPSKLENNSAKKIMNLLLLKNSLINRKNYQMVKRFLKHHHAVVIYCISIRKIRQKHSGSGLLRCLNLNLK